jgi:O-antigen/teichoic acid export membrane protein
MATSTEFALQPAARLSQPNREARARMMGNVFFGALDYLVQPILMLLTARYFVRHLGIEQFGLWMLVLAIVGSMGTFCTGFGDAALKYVSAKRGSGDPEGVIHVIRSAQTLNLALALFMATVFDLCAPWAAVHIFYLSSVLAEAFIAMMRIGSALLVIRSVAFVYISTLRAFERYRTSTQVTATARIATITCALLLVASGRGVVAIVAAASACEAVSLVALIWTSRRVVGRTVLSVDLHWRNWRSLASFGAFTWLQALIGSVFSQADRMLVASMLGPAAVGYYGVCIQAGQPIHGLAASGCNVLFPHLSARLEGEGNTAIRSTISRAIRLNVAVVMALALPLALFSRTILTHWMGAEFAKHASVSLSLVALSFACLAFNIPGHYALMAMGRVQYLAGLNFVGMTVSLAIALLLIPRFGIAGAALGRLAYGPITWALYGKLNPLLRREKIQQNEAALPIQA